MKHIFTFLIYFFPFIVLAGGVKGRIIDQDGKPLPFTTIFIKETGSGSITNENGFYEIKLVPGAYSLTFHHLGYQTQSLMLSIADDVVSYDVVMLKQAYLLGEAEIKAGKEDPAYKIMRKAIAKSSYHRQQIDSYTCQVYVKGGGRLVDAPGIIRRQLEKEGMDTSATFVTESISKIAYTRPEKYVEEVISIRANGDMRNSSPMSYINGSFYNPTVAGLISPLSPKAFAYYKFRYVTTFQEQGYQVIKIQVIPRSKGEEVVTGMLYIVENLWAIHSFDFRINTQGIEIDAMQVFAPVEESVWMPVSHKYDGRGKIFGVSFEFGYLAAVSNYDIRINPDLSNTFTVIDEKTESELIAERDEKPVKPNAIEEVLSDSEKQLLEGKEVTRKELRKVIQAYEKAERQDEGEPQVVRESEFKVDSLAYKSDSLYWADIRPVPLTEREIRGYIVQDSLDLEEKKKMDGDTLASGNSFSPMGILTGHTFNLGDSNYIQLHNPLFGIRFNTVDGWNLEYRVSYFKRFDNKSRFELSPRARYSFSREKWFGTLLSEYKYGNSLKSGSLSLEGGFYYSQFNDDMPIDWFTNSFSTLFVKKNYVKIYDRDFVEGKWRHDITPSIAINTHAAYDIRRETFNTTDQVWLPSDRRVFTPNQPKNNELNDNTGFGRSEAFKVGLGITMQPGLKFGKRNDRYYRTNEPPTITLRYEKAIPDVINSTIDYDFVAAEVIYRFDLNRWGNIGVRSEAGKFLTSGNMDFIDFAHFMGNQTIFTRNGRLNGYSIAPYYDYSTSKEYLSTYINYEMRKFAFTQITLLRVMGLKESFNINHLITPNTNHYIEIGYSMTNLFRFARIDVVMALEDGREADFRIQFGLSSAIFGIE